MKIHKVNIWFVFLLLTVLPSSFLYSQKTTNKDFWGSWDMTYNKEYIDRFIFFKDSLIIKTRDGKKYSGTYVVDIDHNNQYIAFHWLDNSDSVKIGYFIKKYNSQEFKLKGFVSLEYSEKEHKWVIIECEKWQILWLIRDHHSHQG